MKIFLYALLVLSVCAGCMQIDYVGKKFSPSENVKIYRSEADIPTGEYTVIGRFTVSAKPKTHPYEVEDAIFDRAVEYGGDAAVMVDKFPAKHGAYNSDEEEFGTFDRSKSKTPAKEKELFGTGKPLTGGDLWSDRNIYRYLLLKKSKSLNPAE